MNRARLQFGLATLIVMPVMFALGWWARDRNYGEAIKRLEQSVAQLRIERQNERLLDELRGEWRVAFHRRAGEIIQTRDVDGQVVDVEWYLEPERQSQISVLKAEVETSPLGAITVDATKDPAWIDFSWERDGRQRVHHGIVRVRYGFGMATIALSEPSWDGNPIRPTSFKSTHDNGVSVYQLRRVTRY